MKKFWLKILTDGKGDLSSKRLLTLLAFLALIIAFGVDIFAVVIIQPEMINAFLYIVLIGIGAISAEGFSLRKLKEKVMG